MVLSRARATGELLPARWLVAGLLALLLVEAVGLPPAWSWPPTAWP
jgi:hypothetical protein